MSRKLNFNGKGSQTGPWAFRGPCSGPDREREQVLRLGGGAPVQCSSLFGPALAQPPTSRLLLKILKGQTGRVRKLVFGIDLVTIYVFVPPSTQYDRVRKLYFCVDLPENSPVRKFFVPVRTGTKPGIWHRPCHNLRVRTAFHTIRSGTKNDFFA